MGLENPVCTKVGRYLIVSEWIVRILLYVCLTAIVVVETL